MAKLTRYFQKVFGNAANSQELAQYGSFAAGTPADYSGSTVNPDLVQALSNFDRGLFGATIGNGSSLLQDTNAIYWLTTRQLAYLFQAGIPEWNTDTTYYLNSYCQVAGVIYRSKTNTNAGNDPVTSTANWVSIIANSDIVTSSSCGNYSTSVSADITNLSLSITTSGRPVQIWLDANSSSANNIVTMSDSGGTLQLISGAVEFNRSGLGNICKFGIVSQYKATNVTVAISYPSSAFQTIDTPPAGTYTYKATAIVVSGAFGCNNTVLRAREL